jgi:hypothetical protein
VSCINPEPSTSRRSEDSDIDRIRTLKNIGIYVRERQVLISSLVYQPLCSNLGCTG